MEHSPGGKPRALIEMSGHVVMTGLRQICRHSDLGRIGGSPYRSPIEVLLLTALPFYLNGVNRKGCSISATVPGFKCLLFVPSTYLHPLSCLRSPCIIEMPVLRVELPFPTFNARTQSHCRGRESKKVDQSNHGRETQLAAQLPVTNRIHIGWLKRGFIP